MENRVFKGKEISLLGFGLMRLPKVTPTSLDIDEIAAGKLVDYAIANGVNYFDTAYTYRGSEEFAGRILSKYPRESYNLATKCPPWKLKNADDFERIFSESQERCQTDYFDFFLVHNLAEESKRAAGNNEYFEKFRRLGMYEMLQKKKEEGSIRNLGFSFHGTVALMEKLLDNYEWDFAQTQINYIDWKDIDAKRVYEMLTERGIPVIVMEPLRGGALAGLTDEAAAVLKEARPDASIASWGIRYAASLPNVVTVLSGMNSMEQLTDNIATMQRFEPVTAAEKELLDKAGGLYKQSGAVPCTACRYCSPCPQGVDIPRIFSVYNHYRIVKYRIPFDNGYSTLDDNAKASNCAQCNVCVQKCPQHIDIPGYMREIDEFANGSD